MKNRYILFLLSGCAYLFQACAVHTNIEPVGKGKINAYISFGGPTIKVFGLTKPLFPVPHLLTGASYGINENLNVDANLNLLPLPYGIASLETGAIWFPVLGEGKKPTIGLDLHLLSFFSIKSDSNITDRIRVYPLLTPAFSWQLGNHRVYVGSNITIPISQADFDNEATALIVSPFLGFRWGIGEKISLLTELKWQGANVPADKLAIAFASIAEHGGLSPLLGLSWKF